MFSQKFTVATASGASTSAAFDTGDRGITKMGINYATMSTATIVQLWASDSASIDSGTFHPVKISDVNTAVAEHNAIQIATATSGHFWTVLESLPFRHFKLVTTAVVSGGVAYTVMCG